MGPQYTRPPPAIDQHVVFLLPSLSQNGASLRNQFLHHIELDLRHIGADFHDCPGESYYRDLLVTSTSHCAQVVSILDGHLALDTGSFAYKFRMCSCVHHQRDVCSAERGPVQKSS